MKTPTLSETVAAASDKLGPATVVDLVAAVAVVVGDFPEIHGVVVETAAVVAFLEDGTPLRLVGGTSILPEGS